MVTDVREIDKLALWCGMGRFEDAYAPLRFGTGGHPGLKAGIPAWNDHSFRFCRFAFDGGPGVAAALRAASAGDLLPFGLAYIFVRERASG